MAEQYISTQLDRRTFGQQQARLIDDLNRPDLSNIVTQYLQDAMRFFQRKTFFFNNIDNSAVPTWAASTYYPFGTTIQVSVSGTVYAFTQVANPTSAGVTPPLSGTSAPSWPTDVFTVPNSQPPVLPPPVLPADGAVQDNQCIWVNTGNYLQFNTTNLATVYNWNQYQPPIDYVSPFLVEITWSGNERVKLQKISYEELRGYDVIRPSPPYSYPTMWAWFQQMLYLWPYPNSFYPITLSYRAAPQLVQTATDSNYWTTIAERLIRKYAQAAIEREVIYDQAASQISMQAAMEELNALRSQTIQMNSGDRGGIPATDW
jgi:hypothetical protein